MSEEEKKAIEILEEFKKTGFHTLSIKYDKDRVHTNKMIENSIETVLHLLAKILKEYKKKLKNSIRKDKIRELIKDVNETLEYAENSDLYDVIFYMKGVKNSLEELLGETDEKL